MVDAAFNVSGDTSGLEEHAAITNTENEAYARRRNMPKS